MEIVFFGAHGAVPAPESGNVSFLVQAGGRTILVDTSGNPVQSLLAAGADPLALDGLVLTHSHTDHLYALPSLIHALRLMNRKKELVVCTDPFTAERARALLSVFGLSDREGLFPMRYIHAEDPVPIADGAFIRWVPAVHSVPANGFLLTAGGAGLLYTADTAPPSDPERYAGAVDLLIHEASGTAEEEAALNAAGHSSARQAGETARRMRAGALFLCHAPARDGSAAALVAEASAAFSGGSASLPTPFVRYRVEDLARSYSGEPASRQGPAPRACAVVFDFDGTLIDTMEIKVRNYVESVQDIFGIPDSAASTAEAVFTEMAGANRFAQLEATFAKLGLPQPPHQHVEQWSELFSALNRKTLSAIPEFPSARPVITRLRAAGFTTYLASGIPDAELKADIRRRRLDALFDGIRGGDKLEYLATIRSQGYPRICFVGDTGFDRSIAQECGADFFRSDSDESLLRLEKYLEAVTGKRREKE